MFKVFAASLIFVFSTSFGFAQDARISSADRIAKALGIEDMLNVAQQRSVDATKVQMKTVLAQLKQSGLPQDYLAQLSTAVDHMAIKVASAWDPKEATKIYSTAITSALSEEELKDTEQYYATEKGRRVHAAITGGQSLMMDYVNSRTTDVMQTEMAILMDKIKEAARQARAKQP